MMDFDIDDSDNDETGSLDIYGCDDVYDGDGDGNGNGCGFVEGYGELNGNGFCYNGDGAGLPYIDNNMEAKWQIV